MPQHCSRRASLSSLLVFTLPRDVVLLAAWFPVSAEHLQMLATASAVLVVGLTVFTTVVGLQPRVAVPASSALRFRFRICHTR